MDRFKSLIHSNEARPEQIEMFNDMNRNAYNLLQSLKNMKTSRTHLKWLHDSDVETRKRSPEVKTIDFVRNIVRVVLDLICSTFLCQSEYEYDHKRPGQDSNASLPMKHYRRRAVSIIEFGCVFVI